MSELRTKIKEVKRTSKTQIKEIRQTKRNKHFHLDRSRIL